MRLTSEAAYEHARHGFVRRLGTLKRCIENVYSLYLPERFDKPSRNECLDLAINLQSFIFNVFGCIDNLAWVWVKERDIRDKQGRPLRSQKVGLRSGCAAVHETLSHDRNALAHRIPLYVAPYTLNPVKSNEHNELERRKNDAHSRRDYDLWLTLDAEQEELGKFTSLMMHSFSEDARPVSFHIQVLADWNTVVEMADKFLQELAT